MFVVAVIFTIKSEKIEIFKEKIMQQAKNSLEHEDGCHQFDICTTTEQPKVFFLYEVYSTKESFDVHLNSRHFQIFDDETASWVEDKKVNTWTRI
ncbi:putative quinol monooxygenase [Agarilytica rhodophyticola]|uniref:putative quinol monooxygenase n=1 Tax=Agarilytica rhodophyticola TaxID=1737490 RepID=UPI000B342834|nr:antibiotic biosynthesis monooxygenase [Agarilytica rhodophyticola]